MYGSRMHDNFWIIRTYNVSRWCFGKSPNYKGVDIYVFWERQDNCATRSILVEQEVDQAVLQIFDAPAQTRRKGAVAALARKHLIVLSVEKTETGPV